MLVQVDPFIVRLVQYPANGAKPHCTITDRTVHTLQSQWDGPESNDRHNLKTHQ